MSERVNPSAPWTEETGGKEAFPMSHERALPKREKRKQPKDPDKKKGKKGKKEKND